MYSSIFIYGFPLNRVFSYTVLQIRRGNWYNSGIITQISPFKRTYFVIHLIATVLMRGQNIVLLKTEKDLCH